MTKEGLHNLLNLGVEKNAAHFLIFSETKSERLNYVCEFIFNTVLKVNYSITQSLSEFETSNHFKINYYRKHIDKAFQLQPHSLIFETIITEQKPQPIFKNENIYFFETTSSNFHFDVFAATFFFISRLEEWQTFEADTHQRFEAKNSILFQNKFHLKPVVDIWIEELKTALQHFYPTISFPEKKFKAISTIDVDNLYAFKHKGFVRTSGAIAKDILKFDFKNLSARLNVLRGKQKDPFDIYESISEFCLQNNIPLLYFFLFKTGTAHDRTVDPSYPAFKNVFTTLKKYVSPSTGSGVFVGLHPSYNSSVDEAMLKQEVSDFSKALGEPVNISRQHYLRFNIKTTPKHLLQNDIMADFTMGFASQLGFRAGTSQPFYYYDFANEQKTDLIFVPFCAMDGAYLVYDKITPEDTLNSLLQLANEVKKVKGLFITVYHERTFYDELYKGFGEVYKKTYSKIAN
ncbi:MAG: hypothetical protein SFY56_00970 [Bacteroidota bacterium]|nr:hypothetical protein [Bacteroidota bacterium]